MEFNSNKTIISSRGINVTKMFEKNLKKYLHSYRVFCIMSIVDLVQQTAQPAE